MIDYDEVDHYVYRRTVTKTVPSENVPPSVIIPDEEEIIEDDEEEDEE